MGKKETLESIDDANANLAGASELESIDDANAELKKKGESTSGTDTSSSTTKPGTKLKGWQSVPPSTLETTEKKEVAPNATTPPSQDSPYKWSSPNFIAKSPLPQGAGGEVKILNKEEKAKKKTSYEIKEDQIKSGYADTPLKSLQTAKDEFGRPLPTEYKPNEEVLQVSSKLFEGKDITGKQTFEDYLDHLSATDKKLYDQIKGDVLDTTVGLSDSRSYLYNQYALNWKSQQLSNDIDILKSRDADTIVDQFGTKQQQIEILNDEYKSDIDQYNTLGNDLKQVRAEMETSVDPVRRNALSTMEKDIVSQIQQMSPRIEEYQSKLKPLEDEYNNFVAQNADLMKKWGTVWEDANKLNDQFRVNLVNHPNENEKQLKQKLYEMEQEISPWKFDPVAEAGKGAWNAIVDNAMSLLTFSKDFGGLNPIELPLSLMNAEQVDRFKRRAMDEIYNFSDAYLKATVSEQPIFKDGKINTFSLIPSISKTATDMGLLLAGAGALKSVMGASKFAQSGSLIGSSMLQTYDDYKNIAVQNGYSEGDAVRFGLFTSALVSSLEVISPNTMLRGSNLENMALRTAFEELKKKGWKGAAKTFYDVVLKEIGQENLQELTQGYAEKVSNMLMNTVAGDDTKVKLDTEMSSDEIYETILLTTVVTGLMSGGAGYANKGAYRQSALRLAAENFEGFQKMLQDGVAQGKIDPTMAKELTDEVSSVVVTLQQMPKDLSDEKKDALTPLLQKKNELNEQLKVVDKAFAPQIEEQVKAVDEQIKNIVSAPSTKPKETEETPVQEVEKGAQEPEKKEVVTEKMPEYPEGFDVTKYEDIEDKMIMEDMTSEEVDELNKQREQLKLEPYDKKDLKWLPSEEQKGKESVGAEPDKTGGDTKAEAGGIFSFLKKKAKDTLKDALIGEDKSVSFYAPLREVTGDRANRVGSDLLDNVLNGDALFKEAYSKLDIPSRLNVFSRVVRSIKNDEVFGSIVPFIPINVVNMLSGKNFSSEELLRNKSMFVKSLSINDPSDVLPSVIDAIKKASANSGAKSIDAFLSGRGATVLGSTLGADEIIVSEIPSSLFHESKDTKKTDSDVSVQTPEKKAGREIQRFVNEKGTYKKGEGIRLGSYQEAYDFAQKLGETKNVSDEYTSETISRSKGDDKKILDSDGPEHGTRGEEKGKEEKPPYFEQRKSKVDKATPELIDKLVKTLQKAFPKTRVVTDIAEIDRVRQQMVEKGDISKDQADITPLGFVYKGVVYIDPRVAKADTPIHEFGHIWNKFTKENFPEFYNRGLQLIKGTEYETRVRELYPHLKDEEDILEEALTTAIGENGVLISEKEHSFFSWLKELWEKIAGLLNVSSGEKLRSMSLQKYLDIVGEKLLSEKVVSAEDMAKLFVNDVPLQIDLKSALTGMIEKRGVSYQEALNKAKSTATWKSMTEEQKEEFDSWAEEKYGEKPKEPTSKERDKTFLNRIYKAKNVTTETKRKIVNFGLSYLQFTNEESQQIADAIIAEEGIEKAYAMAQDKGAEIRGAVRTMLHARIINYYYEQEQKAKTEDQKEKFASLQADVSNALDEYARDAGQAIQALSHFYKMSPLGVELKIRRQIEKINEEEMTKKRGISYNRTSFREKIQGLKNALKEASSTPVTKKSSGGKKNIFTMGLDERNKRIQELKDRWKKRGPKLTSGGLDPEAIEIAGELGMHYIAKGVVNFAQWSKRVIADLGITEQQAKQVWNEYRIPKQEDEKNRTLKDFVSEELSEVVDKQRKENKIKILEKMFPETKEQKKDPNKKKARKEDFEKILEGIDALTDENGDINDLAKYEKLFYNQLGLVDPTAPDVMSRLKEFSKRISESEGLYKDKATVEMLDYLANLKKESRAKLIMPIMYANMLYGYETHLRNFQWNLYSSGLFHMGLLLGRKPMHAGMLLKAFVQGLKKGQLEARDIMATGNEKTGSPVTEHDLLDRMSKKGFWKALTYYAIPFRLLRSSDAFFNSALTEAKTAHLMIKEMKARNKELPEDQRKSHKEIEAEINNIVFGTQERLAVAKEKAEKETMKFYDINDPMFIDGKRNPVLGSKYNEAYRNFGKRVYQLMEESRPSEITEDAKDWAERALLMGQPKGYLGIIARGLSTIFGAMPAVKMFTMPFVNVPMNVANFMIDWSPLGFINVIAGKEAPLVPKEQLKRHGMATELTSDQKRELIIKSSFSTAAMTVLYLMTQMRYDDDEEGDRPMLIVYGDGVGDWAKNQELRKVKHIPGVDYEVNFEPFTIDFMGMRLSYKSSPMIAWFASIGYIGDYQRFKGGSESATMKKVAMGMYGHLMMTTEQANLSGLRDLLNVGEQAGQFADDATAMEKMGKNLEKTGYKMLRNLVIPNYVSQANNDVRGILELNDKRAINPWEVLIKDVPFADGYLVNRQDHFGRPIKDEFALPFLPSGGIPEDKFYQLVFNKEYGDKLKFYNDRTIFKLDDPMGAQGAEYEISREDVNKINAIRGEYVRNALEDPTTHEDLGGKTTYEYLNSLTPDEFDKAFSHLFSQGTWIAKDEVFGQGLWLEKQGKAESNPEEKFQMRQFKRMYDYEEGRLLRKKRQRGS